jgi:segregation and condensation protein B
MIDDTNINCTVEALIMASPKPVAAQKICGVIGDITPSRVTGAVAELNNKYMLGGHSFRIREVAGGYEFYIMPDFEQPIVALLTREKTMRMTRAALDTLAIIAYKQPVTKVQIEHIRGVSSDGVLHNLLERKMIAISGRAESMGRPLLYKTTDEFLKFFGLNKISDLPQLEEIDDILRQQEEEHRSTADRAPTAGGNGNGNGNGNGDRHRVFVEYVTDSTEENTSILERPHFKQEEPADIDLVEASVESEDEDAVFSNPDRAGTPEYTENATEPDEVSEAPVDESTVRETAVASLHDTPTLSSDVEIPTMSDAEDTADSSTTDNRAHNSSPLPSVED